MPVMDERGWQRWWRSRVLADAMQQAEDNFLLLRALAALAVILGHCYALKSGEFAQDCIAALSLGKGVYMGALAVDLFFFISGFLVTGSWYRQRSAGRFLAARAARILPAYWMLLLLTLLVLGPMTSQLPVAVYLAHAGTWEYLFGNLVYAPHWTLPGVFAGLPYPDVVNGSLWSLRVEVLAYLALAAAGVWGLLKHRMLYLPASLLALLGLHQLPVLGTGDYLWPLTMFALGSLAWTQRDRLPLGTAYLLLLSLACVLSIGQPPFRGLLAVTLGYAALWAAYVPRLWSYNRLGDYSYGLYLYAFPVQQTLIWAWQLDSIWIQFLLASIISGALAAASWHGLEKPVLDWHRRRSRAKQASPTGATQPSASNDMPTVE